MVLADLLKEYCACIPQRFVVASMVMLAVSIQYMSRWALEVAMYVITDEGYHVFGKHAPLCPANQSQAFRYQPVLRTEFYWTRAQQVDLITDFYIGYLLTHIPGGALSDRVGPKMVMGFGTAISGLCVYFTPLCARLFVNPWLLRINRAVMGMAQGPMYPAVSSFIARWAVPGERNIMCAYMNLGISVGTIGSILVIKNLLLYLDTWDQVFYLFGYLIVAFLLAWQFLAQDTPISHPFITDQERDQILDGLGDQRVVGGGRVPVVRILKSLPVWAIFVVNLGHDCNYYALSLLMTEYMDYFLYVNVMANVVTSCGPYLALAILSIISAKFSGLVLKKGWLTRTHQCKVWSIMTNVVSSVFILLGTFSGCSSAAAITCYILAFAFLGFGSSSIWIVNVDMAPNHAGLINGFWNGLGSLLGILYPEVVAVYKEMSTLGQWRVVLLVNLVIVSLATLFFVVFGSSTLQSWNEPATTPEEAPPQLPSGSH